MADVVRSIIGYECATIGGEITLRVSKSGMTRLGKPDGESLMC